MTAFETESLGYEPVVTLVHFEPLRKGELIILCTTRGAEDTAPRVGKEKLPESS